MLLCAKYFKLVHINKKSGILKYAMFSAPFFSEVNLNMFSVQPLLVSERKPHCIIFLPKMGPKDR